MNYPYYLSVTRELVELKYESRSGSQFVIRHTNPQNSMYYDIEIEYPSTSSLSEFIDSVFAQAVADWNAKEKARQAASRNTPTKTKRVGN